MSNTEIRSKNKKWFSCLTGSLLLLAGAVGGCGSDGSGPGTGLQTGSVALVLTDGPTAEFSHVYLTVRRISLLSENRPPVVMFDGEKRIDLLALEDLEDLFMVHDAVPVGLYHKIRLQIGDPMFVTLDGREITGNDIQLTANGKLDLVPRGPIAVVSGEMLTVRLDLDARKSIHIHSTGKGRYLFRPVVFIQVSDAFRSRFVSVDGTVLSVDPGSRTLVVGMARSDSHDGDDATDDRHGDLRRLRVTVPVEAGIFQADGRPGSFDALAVGQNVRIRGRLTRFDGFRLEAELIQIGSPLRLQGMILRETDSDTDAFDLRIDPGQGLSGDLTVQLYPETRLWEAGTQRELGREALTEGTHVTVEGVVELSVEPDRMHAALIQVKTPDQEVGRLEGIVEDLEVDRREFLLRASPATCDPPSTCPDPIPPVRVHVVDDAVILSLTHREDGDDSRDDRVGEDHLKIDWVSLSALSNGDRVVLFGRFDSTGIFQARVVILEEEGLLTS